MHRGIEDDELEGRKRWHGTQRETRRLKGLLDGWHKEKAREMKGRNREAMIEESVQFKRERERNRQKGERGEERGEGGGGGDLIRSSNDPGAVFPSLSR